MSIASHSTQCAICLGDYQAGDIICSSHNSKCTHHFHQTCIFEWLLQDRDDCPCCRNNYLALSDVDDDDDDDDNTNNNNNDEYMEHSNHGSNYINEPSQNQTDTTQFLASRNDDWIPSYLAPFHSTTHDIQTHNEQHRISTARSSSDLMTSVHVGRWSDDDDGEDSRSTDPDISDVDAWSCPSVEESVEEPYDVDTYRRRLQLRKRQGTRRSPRAVNESNNEQTQSLQLDDLILEGLMQHLQDRAEEQSTRTASSSSIYTEGAGDVEAPPNTGILSNLLRDESEVCAICCTEYAVNEELCWSQDPACSHVFHRRCMQQWISEKKDYCPFCRVQYDENRSSFPFTTPTSLPDSSQQGQCHATFHPSSNNDEAATGRSYFEFSRRNESDCTSEVSAASLLSINMDLVAEA